jgi:hypothetical protein
MLTVLIQKKEYKMSYLRIDFLLMFKISILLMGEHSSPWGG